MRRWVLVLAGLVLSLAVTVALWAAGVPGFFLFLALPFLFFPLPLRPRRSSLAGAPSTACPACGATRALDHRFCPTCGARLP